MLDFVLVDLCFHNADSFFEYFGLIFVFAILHFELMDLVFQLLNHLQFFGVVELRVLDGLQLAPQTLNSLIFTLHYLFISSLCLMVAGLFLHDMLTQSLKFLLNNFDLFID